MRKILNAFPSMLLVFCLIAPASTPAHACSCIGPTRACQGFWDTSVVFLGRALDVRVAWSVDDSYGQSYYHRYRSALFYVEAVFKGMKESGVVVDVGTGMGGGDCGYSFKTGERYLVFGDRLPGSGRIVTGICHLTHPVTDDDADLEYLRSLPTAPEEGYVFGIVRSFWDPMGEPGSRDMPGVEIFLEGKSGHYDATTDETGSYRIDHLPPGAYKYHIDLPGAEEPHRAGEIHLRPKGCFELFFIYEVNPKSAAPPVHPGSPSSMDGNPHAGGDTSRASGEEPGARTTGRTREETRNRTRSTLGRLPMALP